MPIYVYIHMPIYVHIHMPIDVVTYSWYANTCRRRACCRVEEVNFWIFLRRLLRVPIHFWIASRLEAPLYA